ncbi:Gfo/Idh/MocA family protein [Prevotella sp. oral taxon 376]|uniref:Gfo/Idh/MocA family protein n=1 Tax=Prevotella sp. oral taxon 376 TaxID=712466 RepID=UPI001E4AEA87|nr:Gfo/Idh/MocA family oxidoreductase [Prevotella sp. oral taxon 376]
MLAAGQEVAFNWPYKVVDGTIVTETPARPTGQRTALGLTVPKMSVVRVGFVGLGMRGPDAVRRWTYINGTEVKALCDHERERAEKCNEILRGASFPAADVYAGEDGYKQLCERKDIDLVYIATDWLHHFVVAKYALEHGKHVAIEVPSAMSLTEIWELINLSESKRLHCMMLENCCYDFFELNSLNMAQHGVFGEVLYVSGAYRHDLSPFWDAYWKKDANDKLGWRLDYNRKFRGDVYATHGLGPIAQVLNIHRGDRMRTLVAMDTKSVNGKAWVEKMSGQSCADFANGDHTTTLIRTERGRVIEVQHNTMTPQPYNRMYQLVGTRGFANKYPVEGYALSGKEMKNVGVTPSADDLSGHSYMKPADRKALEAKYESPLLKKYASEAKEVGGHGGMDFIMDSRLVYCLQHGLPLDMDVYDLAEWCCLAELGSLSMNHGCMPVEVPDFTRGHWNEQKSYRHAFATPEEEAAADKVSAEFTARLKAKGAKYWKKHADKK